MKLVSEILSIVTIILMGTMAGFFFAFSNTVMPGFDISDPISAIEGMQGTNLVVRNPVFFVTFFLTPVVALIAAATAWFAKRKQAAVLLGVSAALYFCGAFLVTVIHHIPLNEALAVIDARALEGTAAEVWATYSENWTPMNTLRAVACMIALVPLVYAVVGLRGQDTMA